MPHSHSYVPRRRRRCSWSLLMGDGAYPRYLLNREMGLLSTRATGFSTDVNAVVQQNYKNLLKSSPVEETLQFPNIFDPKKDGTHPPGGIYNLEFNTEGSLLAAATENTSVLLFDPNSRKLVNTIVNAHDGCVNCVRFLDSRSFATCSDDTTVALWDARYLKTKVRSLKGHANWVKNIEYSFKENLLVTSGGDQMVISTMNGYILIIHDLSLKTLKKDLEGFKPNLYRLLQSLVIFSSDNRSEWCCVHDLHSYPTNPLEDEMISSSSSDQRSPSFSNEAPQPSNSENIFSRLSNFMSNSLSSPESLDHIIPIRFHRRRGAGVGGGGGGDGEEVEDNSNEETERRPSAELGFSSLRMSVQRMIEDFQNHTQRQNNESDNNQGSSRIFLISPDNNQIFLIGPSSLSSSSSSKESNTGRGLIKEVSFSSDGRIICSPFGFGIRLLGFDSKCSELNRCLSTEQRQLTELGTVTGRT
ncbi:DCAF10 [Lepeophtheirus salmonis]|uniref:DCAF10 n=1 Tax=Lepeophtheirus salmonis TaxID=72036 RepID=A0A7R8CI28_LEPSM|nr:DCAF10 [Lepeophtheirus salmonis]CAF2796816.1 DCAF10 [Lepeophtheirus salmonis]